MGASDKENIALWEQYKKNLDTYKKFCEYLERELNALLKSTEVPYFELCHRVKTWDSIQEKIERNNLNPQCIQDIHDVIGFRIIALFKRDTVVICDMIRDKMQVIWESNKAEEKPDDVFGYLSVHFQIRLPDQWLQVPTASDFSGLEAEIQVRTFSQHIWAASSHLLQYKKEATIPNVMRRSIYRLAAVLEIVDDELETVLSSREAYQQALQKENLSGDELLDSVRLEHILDKAFLGRGKRAREPYDVLLQELLFCGINSTEQLESVLNAAEKEIRRLEEKRSGSFYSYAGKLRIALNHCKPRLYRKLCQMERERKQS